jgi:hypothetical protein
MPDDSVSREDLYGLVWAKPMLRVAEQFGVSSSYMARVCEQLHVPRPERGYWAKLEAGKAPGMPRLPVAPPGVPISWSPGIALNGPITRPVSSGVRPLRSGRAQMAQVHQLLAGAREHFTKGRTSRECGYLKPSKWHLPDLTVTEASLETALSLANSLYQQLEVVGGRVVLAPGGYEFRRAKVGELEDGSEINYNNLWSPGRCTVVYFDDLAIGLSIGEIAEVVEARYVKGEYYREGSPEAEKARKSQYIHSWTTKKAFATGRLFLVAYSPYHVAKWEHRWTEKAAGDLGGRVHAICSFLRKSVDEISGLVARGEEQARLKRETWERERREYELQQERARREKAREASKTQLLEIFRRWNEAAQIRQFLEEASTLAVSLDDLARARYQARLIEARAILPELDLTKALMAWVPPGEI